MKNKILLLIILCFLLCGCNNYRELNDMAIVTVVSIDKVDNKYELGFLIANSQNAQTTSKEGEAQTTLYTAKGDTIAEAAEHIDFKTPKQLYLGHVNVVIISEKIGKEGFFKVSDFLMRYPDTRKQFYLMQTKDCEAKDILKLVSPLESFPSQHIASLLKSNRDTESITQVVDYASFIGIILEKGIDPTLPVITVIGDESKGDDAKSLQSTQQSTYLKLVSTAIYHNDKFVDYLNFSDDLMVNIVNNEIEEMKTIFKYKDYKVGFNSDNIKSKVKVNGTDSVDILVSGEGMISEINGDIDLEDSAVLNGIESSLNSDIKKRMLKVIKIMQKKYNTDVFGFGNKLYKNNPKEWSKVGTSWNDKYFPDLKINIKTNIKISSKGSLNKTIKGGAE